MARLEQDSDAPGMNDGKPLFLRLESNEDARLAKIFSNFQDPEECLLTIKEVFAHIKNIVPVYTYVLPEDVLTVIKETVTNPPDFTQHAVRVLSQPNVVRATKAVVNELLNRHRPKPLRKTGQLFNGNYADVYILAKAQDVYNVLFTRHWATFEAARLLLQGKVEGVELSQRYPSELRNLSKDEAYYVVNLINQVASQLDQEYVQQREQTSSSSS